MTSKLYKIVLATMILTPLCATQQTQSGIGALEKRKVVLTAEVEKQVGNCKCLVGLIDRQENLFPEKAKNNETTRVKYLEYIADMKINAGKAQTAAKKIIHDWPDSKNSEQDLKNLDIKVSEDLRALSSFCIQPFVRIADEITDLSKGKVKIDAKQCGVDAKLKKYTGFFGKIFKK